MRDAIVAITASEAASAAESVRDAGGDRREVALAAMRAARGGFMAPEENEAFAAAVGALWRLYPDDEELRQETTAIGDRNKMLSALMSGVPVDMEAWEPTPVPDNALGLIELWRESSS